MACPAPPRRGLRLCTRRAVPTGLSGHEGFQRSRRRPTGAAPGAPWNFTIIGPVNETFRLEELPDYYGVPILVAASTAERICLSRASPDKALAGSKLVRLDQVALKGFAEPRSIYALVPDDDPGLATFVAGREALDQHRLQEGVALLKCVDTGMLARAARVIAARGTAPIAPP
jgi:hypothetical protein